MNSDIHLHDNENYLAAKTFRWFVWLALVVLEVELQHKFQHFNFFFLFNSVRTIFYIGCIRRMRISLLRKWEKKN